MLNFPRWKTIAILASIALAVLLALPNVLPPGLQATLREWNLRPVTLGLDLQGGSNVLLEVDRADLLDKLSRQLASDVRNTMRESKIGYSGLTRTDNTVRVRVTKPEDADKANTELRKLLNPLDSGMFGAGGAVNLFDLSRDGQLFTFSFSEKGLDAKIALAVGQSLKIVENRVNALGTSEPIIQQQGKDRIVVQLPGVQNPDQVKNVIGRTAKLTFQMVCEAQPTAKGQNPPPECQSFPLKDDPEQQLWVQSSSRATV